MKTDCLITKKRNSLTPQVSTSGESSTKRVILLSLGVMVLEIICGKLFGSMALLADGWHMGTHVFALGITVVAYMLSRKYVDDNRFTFGVGKIGVMGGFISALFLAAIAFMMISESIHRLLNPETIQFNQAILVATLGLIVNTVSAVWLHGGFSGSEHDHSHHHAHHHDHNLKAAYLHVIADALTSVLAIIALIAGKYLGWIKLDALVGIVGALVILRWAWGLLKETGAELLDFHDNPELKIKIKSVIENNGCCHVHSIGLMSSQQHNPRVIAKVICHNKCSINNLQKKLQDSLHLDDSIIELSLCDCKPCPIQFA